MDGLPAEFREQMRNIEIVVDDEPTPEQMRGGGELLGLYEGVPLTDRGAMEPYLPDRISIFRGPIERMTLIAAAAGGDRPRHRRARDRAPLRHQRRTPSRAGPWATKTDPETPAVRFLRDRFGGTAQIQAIRPGEWSVPYSVRTADADLVVRFSAYDEDFEKDAFATRYSSPALPIPPIIEWGPALDGFYAVAERVGGEHIDGLDETRMRRVLPSLFAAMDAMREVDLSDASGYGGWRADGRTSHRSWREWLLIAFSLDAMMLSIW